MTYTPGIDLLPRRPPLDRQLLPPNLVGPGHSISIAIYNLSERKFSVMGDLQ